MTRGRSILPLTLLLLACGGGEPAADDADAPEAASSQAEPAAPCDILREVLPPATGVAAEDMEFDPSSEGSSNPYCQAKWMSSPEATYADASAFLTMVGRPFADADATVSALETLVGRLREGVTAEAEGTEVTLQSDYTEWVEDVGTAAAWNPRMSQVSVAAGRTMFHMQVRGTGDEARDKELAIDIAGAIVEGL